MTLAINLLQDFAARGARDAVKRADMLTAWQYRHGWTADEALAAFRQLFRDNLIWRGPAGWYLTALGKRALSAVAEPTAEVAL